MPSRVVSFVLQGIDAQPCEVEVDLDQEALTPRIVVVGLPDAAVRESIERVRSAVEHAGLRFPFGRVTVNLAPAHLRKEGPVYDLPIAAALLMATQVINPVHPDAPDPEELLIAGELALDGRLRPVRGAVSMAMLARQMRRPAILVPAENAPEAAIVRETRVLPVAHLSDVVRYLNGHLAIEPHPPVDLEALVAEQTLDIDFGDVRGQEPAKRALTVAAAGGHNVLMIGPAGTGKTMMARALPGVLPAMTREEALDVTRIHSCAGMGGSGGSLMLTRPVRAPHHTASPAAIVGGGSSPRPGDVSLAHRGILFLDEVPEFARDVLETLRQPLEDGVVTIARASGSVRFPARFMLVGALNPTPRGHMANDPAGQRDMSKYLSRLSGPLIDRIDIHVEVPAVRFRDLQGEQRGTDTALMRERVRAARSAQFARQGAVLNSELKGRQLARAVKLEDEALALMERAIADLGLSARAYDKVRRVARTIADLETCEHVGPVHIAEAIGYRLLDRLGAMV